jgi:hypothetical protein
MRKFLGYWGKAIWPVWLEFNKQRGKGRKRAR